MQKLEIPHKPFYFLRHGETSWNAEHRIMGQTNIPLNSVGIQQAESVAKLLKTHAHFESIATSPLKRALQTAEIIAQACNKPIKIIDGLQEATWGILEGSIIHDFLAFDRWKNGHPMEGGEKYDEFLKRITLGFHNALSLTSEPVLIVSHGGVYWEIQSLLKLPQRKFSNCTPLFHQPTQNPNNIWSVTKIYLRKKE